MSRRANTDRRIIRFGGAMSWTPASLAGVTAWYRADLGVTNVSGKASAWACQIPGDANKNLAQGTAGLRPTINAMDAGYNNQSTLSSAATIFMASGAWAASVAQPFSWFVIGEDDGTIAAEYWIEGNISGVNRSILGANIIAGNQYGTYSGTELSTGVRGATKRMIGGINNGASSSVFNNSMTAGNTGAAGANGITGITAFASFAGTANLIGKLAEIVICSGAMSAGDRALLRSYFNARYAMSITA